MTIRSVNARFMMVLLPLLALCFVLISGVTYYMASESLSGSAVTVARCLGNEAALRMQISVADIQLPLKVAAAHPNAFLSGDEGEIIGITTATYASAQNINMAVKIKEVIALFNKWDKKTTTQIGYMKGNSYPSVSSSQQAAEGGTVWVTKTGKKYHSSPYCSKMTSPIEMDLLEAIEKGYQPCGKCYK